jgi:hypothetical protein
MLAILLKNSHPHQILKVAISTITLSSAAAMARSNFESYTAGSLSGNSKDAEVAGNWLGVYLDPVLRQTLFIGISLIAFLVLIWIGHKIYRRLRFCFKEIHERRYIKRQLWDLIFRVLNNSEPALFAIEQTLKTLSRQMTATDRGRQDGMKQRNEYLPSGSGYQSISANVGTPGLAELVKAEKQLAQSNEVLAGAFDSAFIQLRNWIEQDYKNELQHLKEELTTKQTQAEEWAKQEKASQEQWITSLSELKNENRAMRAGLLFLRGDDGPLREAISTFTVLEQNLNGIRETFQRLHKSWKIWPEGVYFSCDPVDPILEIWVTGRKTELDSLLKNRFLGAPELVQHLEGQELTSSELLSELRQRFYFRAVANHLDRMLRELQHFYIYGHICELREGQLSEYEQTCAQLHKHEESARSALAAIGIQPLILNVLQRVPEGIAQCVSYCEKAPADLFYPKWPAANQLPGGIVLDIVRWAYLNPEHKLWNDTTAQVVVSK